MIQLDVPTEFSNLLTLMDKVDAHWKRFSASHPLACTLGCTACCRHAFGVTRIEADLILEAVSDWHREPAELGAADGHRLFSQLAGPTPCPFLGKAGGCTIYQVRPIICRSHGLPIHTGDRVDLCPLNAPLASGPTLNLGLLNTTLSALDLLYGKERCRPTERVPLLALADALERRPSATKSDTSTDQP